jgi:antitoxin component YwqK of YwqJK toxin-antitoxin module
MVGMCFSFLSFSQQYQQVKTFYDYNKKYLKEEFYVLKKNDQVRDSSYIAYYQSGQKKTIGSYKKNKAEGLWRFFYENGNVKMEGTMKLGEKNGVWKYYYENGGVSMQGESAAGAKTGIWQYFYENGKVRSEGEFVGDKRNGPWNYYYEDGILKAMATYEDDKGDYMELYPSGKLKASGRIEDGKSVGVWTYYHEDGSILATGEEVGGLKTGKWTYYYPNGQIASEGEYANGKSVGPWKYYYETGIVSAEGNMNNGNKDGAWKIYYKSGQFKGETNYVNGEGLYKEYYEGGALRTEGKIINEKHEGSWNYYLENGVLEGTCVYVRGKGLYKGYYGDGKLKMEGQLENGNKVGVWTLYNEDGTIAGYYKTYYENESPNLNADSLLVNKPLKDTLAPSEKPKYVTPKRKSRYFTPRVNEVRALIVSSNPFYLLASSFPLSVEYYLQERMGYEIGGLFFYKPFFNSHSNIPSNTIYYSGAELYFRQKFYQKDQEYGMLYFAHELRYGYYNFENNFIDFTSATPGPSVHLEQIQNRIEYSFLLGDRIMIDQRKKGWTFDVFGGIGIGYRTVSYNWQGSVDKYTNSFTGIYSKSIAVPFRFGFTIGYKFPKK